MSTRKQVASQPIMIDWAAITGEQVQDPWQEDRLRKFSKMAVAAQRLLELGDALEALGALYQSTPRVLRCLPDSAAYYIALAGYSQKTLRNSIAHAKRGGLTKSPESYAKALAAGSARITDAEVTQFSNWVNAEIRTVLPIEPTDSRIFHAIVAMVAGGRIIGQTQNEGGNLAVDILKRALLEEFGPLTDWRFAGALEKKTLSANAALEAVIWHYIPTGAMVDFRGGGNRPDIVISRKGMERLVGEVKGRKDLSNLWESWMPQLADHLRTWANTYPHAVRGAFMTLINQDMIIGASRMGVERTGLQAEHAANRLQFVVNLSRLDVVPNQVLLRQVLEYGLGRAR